MPSAPKMEVICIRDARARTISLVDQCDRMGLGNAKSQSHTAESIVLGKETMAFATAGSIEHRLLAEFAVGATC
jgi:hypothetical protein